MLNPHWTYSWGYLPYELHFKIGYYGVTHLWYTYGVSPIRFTRMFFSPISNINDTLESILLFTIRIFRIKNKIYRYWPILYVNIFELTNGLSAQGKCFQQSVNVSPYAVKINPYNALTATILTILYYTFSIKVQTKIFTKYSSLRTRW